MTKAIQMVRMMDAEIQKRVIQKASPELREIMVNEVSYNATPKHIEELKKLYEEVQEEVKLQFMALDHTDGTTHVPSIPDDEIFNPYNKEGY